ncbi:hypothetical protein C8J56DRAFT_1046788 [Mycena floridula]|nr:hypothetical protein C8J56DRAFT_1046788 [Mycena floridula]
MNLALAGFLLSPSSAASAAPPFTSRDFSIPNSLDKLRSGHSLTDLEAVSILFQLPIAAAELGRYDAHIAHLRLLIGNLELERDNLSTAIIHNRALTSPIRRIPVEILTIIFEWSLEPDPKAHHETDLIFLNDFTEPETLQISILTGVCAFWRNIAVNNRQLWSNIGVNLGSCTESTARLINLHRQRSRKLPLSLTIRDLHSSSSREINNPYDLDRCFCCYDPRCAACDMCRLCGNHSPTCKLNRPIDPTHQMLKQVKESLVNLAPRFTTLVVYGFRWAFPFGNVSEKMAFTSLESLELRLDPWVKPGDDGEMTFRPSHHMPKLHSVTLEHVPIDSPYFEFYLPFEQITSLQINNTFLENIIRVTQQCPKLEHLSVQFQYIWDENDDKYDELSDDYIIHDELYSLQITVPDRHDPEAVAFLFNSLTAPSLHSVNLTGIAWPCPAFNSLIDRSECSIEQLALHQIDLVDWLLADTINLMPNLTKLGWTDMFFADGKDQTAYNDFLQLIPNHLPDLTEIDFRLSLQFVREAHRAHQLL